MPSPLIILIGIFLIDFLLKMWSDKEKQSQKDLDKTTSNPKHAQKQTTFGEFMKSLQENFDIELEDEKPQASIIEEVKVEEVGREGVTSQKRVDRIDAQRAREMEHSELERSNRLHKDKLFKESRLSEQRAVLSSNAKKRIGESDTLDTIRPVTIKANEMALEESKTKRSSLLNIKDDILKGVIYSEILNKPKSLQDK